VEEGLKKNKQRPLGVEGAELGRWILMDYGDMVAHIFLGEVRAFYDLEGLWVDASKVPLEAEMREAEGDPVKGSPFLEPGSHR
jgi:ribosome-associated protein